MNLPFIPSREIIGFETAPMTLEVGRKKSINSINVSKSIFYNKIVIVAQKNINASTIKEKDELYEYGIQCSVTNTEPIVGGHLKLHLICEKRVRVINIDPLAVDGEGVGFFRSEERRVGKECRL